MLAGEAVSNVESPYGQEERREGERRNRRRQGPLSPPAGQALMCPGCLPRGGLWRRELLWDVGSPVARQVWVWTGKGHFWKKERCVLLHHPLNGLSTPKDMAEKVEGEAGAPSDPDKTTGSGRSRWPAELVDVFAGSSFSIMKNPPESTASQTISPALSNCPPNAHLPVPLSGGLECQLLWSKGNHLHRKITHAEHSLGTFGH